MAKKPEVENEMIARADVEPCSPEIVYLEMDRQIKIRAEMIDGDGNYYGQPADESFYSVLQSYFSAGIESAEELKALEDCFLFGLTEIAKQRAKLQGGK